MLLVSRAEAGVQGANAVALQPWIPAFEPLSRE